MKTVVCVLIFAAVGRLTNCNCLLAQNNRYQETEVVTRQCSAIRELVYAAWTNKFKMVLAEQLRSSNGYQAEGSWQFATTRYNTGIAWQGANISYIEHHEERTDTSHTDQWQYIAEYSHVPDVLEAQRLFSQLNTEISGCIYPLNDSSDLEFKPLPPEALPQERPAALEIASLYELPLADSSNGLQPAGIMLMLGMEKRAKDYRVSLIVENMRIDTSSRIVGKLKY